MSLQNKYDSILHSLMDIHRVPTPAGCDDAHKYSSCDFTEVPDDKNDATILFLFTGGSLEIMA